MENPTDPAAVLMKAIFQRHDKDGTGEMDLQEVRGILDEHGIEHDDEELEAMMKKFDVDGSGTLGFEEFVELMADLKVATICALIPPLPPSPHSGRDSYRGEACCQL